MPNTPSSDVLERLRERVEALHTFPMDVRAAELLTEAAATIERLSAELERLKSVATDARKWISIHHGSDLPLVRELDAALTASPEAVAQPR